MEVLPARTLEAAGATSVDFEFRGAPLTIPLAIEDWPLAALRAGKPSIAVRQLLAGQKPAMRTRGDVVELSHRMADACGITPLPEAPSPAGAMFGAVPTLLHAVDNHGDDLEADLLRFFGVDYRKPREVGGPTLRQVWTYIRRIPRESALLAAFNKGEPPWSREAVVAARHWELWARQRYPGRPITREEMEEWLAKQQADKNHMDRLAEREEYYRSGQNMRDAGLDPGPRPPKQPPMQRPDSSPAERALAVARRNAARTPQKGTTDGRIENPRGTIPYNIHGSGW